MDSCLNLSAGQKHSSGNVIHQEYSNICSPQARPSSASEKSGIQSYSQTRKICGAKNRHRKSIPSPDIPLLAVKLLGKLSDRLESSEGRRQDVSSFRWNSLLEVEGSMKASERVARENHITKLAMLGFHDTRAIGKWEK
jgi:hypothetical protein